jgi:hypothetical protein
MGALPVYFCSFLGADIFLRGVAQHLQKMQKADKPLGHPKRFIGSKAH